MAIKRFRAEKHKPSSGEDVEPSPQHRPLTPAWVPWIVTFLALVALPFVFSEEFSLWREESMRVATPNVRPIRYDRLPIVEGYNPPGQGSDVVRFGALTVPSFFDNFEGGDLRMWTTAVGESKNTPSP